MRVGTFNVASARRFDRVAQALIASEVDCVVLNECPPERATALARATGLTHLAYAPADFEGNALLSRFEFVRESGEEKTEGEVETEADVEVIASAGSTVGSGGPLVAVLRVGDAEARSAVLAGIRTPFGPVLGFCGTHLCHMREQRRVSQALQLVRLTLGHEESSRAAPSSEFDLHSWDGVRTAAAVAATNVAGVEEAITTCPDDEREREAERLVPLLAPESDLSTTECDLSTFTPAPADFRWACEGDCVVAGDFNALKRADYNDRQWHQVNANRNRVARPAARNDVVGYLEEHGFVDACPAVGSAEASVLPPWRSDIISVPDTTPYGTRVDFVWLSKDCSWQVVQGSYTVVDMVQSHTSDHNLVYVDIEPKQEVN